MEWMIEMFRALGPKNLLRELQVFMACTAAWYCLYHDGFINRATLSFGGPPTNRVALASFDLTYVACAYFMPGLTLGTTLGTVLGLHYADKTDDVKKEVGA